MSLSSWQLVGGGLTLPIGDGRLPTKPAALTSSKRRALPLHQVRSEEKQESGPPKACNLSRRDIMRTLPAATVAAVTFFSVKPAEARVVKPEIRRKIREKLEMLREKAGLSKPKQRSPPSSENKKLQIFPPVAPLPGPQVSPIVPPVVEALLP